MRRRKLLIADDSEMNRAILANVLDQEFKLLKQQMGRKSSLRCRAMARRFPHCCWIL